MLEGGDRTVGIGEGGLEMGEYLRCRPGRGSGGRPGRQLGRRAPRRQCRADLALALVEAFPDALPGAVAEMAVGSADGFAYTFFRGGAFQKPPQTAGGQAESADFVGTPDAEGPPATRACIAVAAKDPPGADRFLPGVALVKTAQKAVPIQRADHLAVRTRHQLELLGKRVPFLAAAAKPSLLAHLDHAPTKIVILPAWGSSGVEAGYDGKSWAGCGVLLGASSTAAISCQIRSVTKLLKSDDNSAIFAPKCDQSEVKDK